MFTTLKTLFLAATAISATILPIRQTSQPCKERSQYLKHWNISRFQYNGQWVFTNPSHQVSVGHINFTLHNPALDYSSICTAKSTRLQDFFYGEVVYHCQDSEAQPGHQANFTYAFPSGELAINQTWNCPAEGALFAAEGTVKLNLTFVEMNWISPGPPDVEGWASIRTVLSEYVDIKVPIQKLSAVMR